MLAPRRGGSKRGEVCPTHRGRVAHADAMDADAGGGVHHHAAQPHLGLDGGVEHGLLLLEVQHQAQLGQGQAGGPGQPEQGVVQVDRIAAQAPVVGGAWAKEAGGTSITHRLITNQIWKHCLTFP